jgi:hypothetical protein
MHQGQIMVGVRFTVFVAVIEVRWKLGFRKVLGLEFRHPFLGDC